MRTFTVLAALALSCVFGAYADSTGVGDLNAGWNPPGNNGQVNGNFQYTRIDNFANAGALELGLRAEQRQFGSIAPSGSTYSVQTGPDADPLTNGYAWWSFDWSAAYAGGLDNLRHLYLKISKNGTLEETLDFVPQIPTGTTLGQDSWNLGMGFLNTSAWFNLDENATYHFELEAVRGDFTASTSMDVVATPEPAELGLATVAFGAVLAVIRRRKLSA